MFNPLRGADAWGNGYFGASRGNRPHLGADYVIEEGETVFAPFEMFIDRVSRPYIDDKNLTGIKFTSTINDITYDGRMWYFVPNTSNIGVFVSKGQALGIGQNLKDRYDSITNHVHLQLRTREDVPSSIEQIKYNGWTYVNPEYFV